MRTASIALLALAVSACTTSLERQASPTARGDCRAQAEAHVRANIASIANEWREHEKYKQYQKCLWERTRSSS